MLLIVGLRFIFAEPINNLGQFGSIALYATQSYKGLKKWALAMCGMSLNFLKKIL